MAGDPPHGTKLLIQAWFKSKMAHYSMLEVFCSLPVIFLVFTLSSRSLRGHVQSDPKAEHVSWDSKLPNCPMPGRQLVLVTLSMFDGMPLWLIVSSAQTAALRASNNRVSNGKQQQQQQQQQHPRHPNLLRR